MATCQDCRHWTSRSEGLTGDCGRGTPLVQVTFRPGEPLRAAWVQVSHREFACDQWQPRGNGGPTR